MKTAHIYVLSLVGQTARREAVSAQLQQSPAPWSFFDAIDCRAVNMRETWGEAGLERGVRHLRRKLSEGEMACAESHHSIYKEIAGSNFDFGIVLEDDCVLTPKFNRCIQLMLNSADCDFDVVLLGYSKLPEAEEHLLYRFEPIKCVKRFGEFRAGQAWRNWTSGTVGYVISREAAKKIVASKRLFSVADDWTGISTWYGLSVMHLRPLVVFEDFERFASSIEEDRQHFISSYRNKSLDLLRHARGYFRAAAIRFRHFA